MESAIQESYLKSKIQANLINTLLNSSIYNLRKNWNREIFSIPFFDVSFVFGSSEHDLASLGKCLYVLFIYVLRVYITPDLPQELIHGS